MKGSGSVSASKREGTQAHKTPSRSRDICSSYIKFENFACKRGNSVQILPRNNKNLENNSHFPPPHKEVNLSTILLSISNFWFELVLQHVSGWYSFDKYTCTSYAAIWLVRLLHTTAHRGPAPRSADGYSRAQTPGLGAPPPPPPPTGPPT